MDTYGKARRHKAKTFIERLNKDTRKRLYSIRAANGWDQLPEDIANAKSLSTFKKELDSYFGEKR